MYFSYSISKYLISIIILAMQGVSSLNLTNEYLNHKCRASQGKYKPGSTYEENLNFLSHSVSVKPYSPSNFNHITYGEHPNSVTIILQCRGDTYGSKCRSCVTTAIAELRKRCPRNKGGTIWYDQCFLEISMIEEMNPRNIIYENVFSMHNQKNVIGDTKAFNENTRRFLYTLTLKADKLNPEGNLKVNYAVGEMKLGTKKLYAMVQCTEDADDCKACLEWSIRELSKCCGSKQGARVLGSTCNIRYEFYPFVRT